MSENIYNNNTEIILSLLLSVIEENGIGSAAYDEFLQNHHEYHKEIKDFTSSWTNLGEIYTPSPSVGMDAGFYKMLSEQTDINGNVSTYESIWMKVKRAIKTKLTDSRIWMIIGSIVAAFFIGRMTIPTNNQNGLKLQDVEDENTIYFANYEESTFDKMEAIQKSSKVDKPEDVVLDMLRKRLLYDNSVSVRLSALEVLMKFADQPKVRGYLIESIPHQTEPIVIMELADLMNQLEETASKEKWKELLNSDNIETDVRLQIEDKLNTLL